MDRKIHLFIDDTRFPGEYFKGSKRLQEVPLFGWYIARDVEDALWHVENYGIPEFISFGDLDGSGKDILKFAELFNKFMHDGQMNKKLPENFAYSINVDNGTKDLRDFLEEKFPRRRV